MNILLLDVYPHVNYRMSKDQNGGYGTANDYGKTLFTKFLKFVVNKSIEFPPLFSVQVLSELKDANHSVEYSKTIPDNLEFFDFIVLASSIVCHETEIDTIKKLKKFNKIVFAIGPFATSNPDSYIQAGAKVVKGEPEMFFHKFKKSNEEIKQLPNLIDNVNNIDINDLAIPAWDIIFKNYTPRFKFLGKEPAVNINASRGCPYSCFYYCVYPLQQGRKLRLKNPDKLLNEIKYLKSSLGVNIFIFRDPVFSIDRKHTIEICKKIIEANLNIKICIETHLKNIDDEMADYFKKAGVKLIYVGIESAVDEVRKDSNRQSEANDKQIQKINYLEKIGIKVKAMYIIGLPTDNKKTFAETLNYAKKINSSYAQFSVFTPYPGTPVFSEYKDKINVKNYEEFTQWQLVFDHPNFSKNEIDDILSSAYQKYYLNPKWLLKHFKSKFL